MTSENIKALGPLATLAGVWEGQKGEDTAPSPERATAISKYRERMVFEAIGEVDNHEQILQALRYSTMAWRLGEDDPFHEELGYWLWDAKAKQVMRCFMVPRGVTIIAGGTVEADAKEFELAAELGSKTYGICSNLFLDEEFRTVAYDLKINVHDHDSFSYEEDLQLLIKGQAEPFHHIDRNTMSRVE